MSAVEELAKLPGYSDDGLTAVVPIHDEAARAQLLVRWAAAPLCASPDQPLDEVRDYFGEKLALYFAYLQTLTRALLVPSAVGGVAVA